MEIAFNEKHIEHYSFRSNDCLGKGTFGTVYKGKNVKNGEIVAIKVIDKHCVNLKDQFIAESLKKEIEILKTLKSPHIVQMYDVYGTSNNIYMMIEFCEGGDLRNFLKKNDYKLEENVAVDIIRQLMHGFKELVDHGYIHRDIKPENSLISKGIHKVADFGLATKIDITGRELIRECVGSPLYMSPQLLEKKPYSAKSDIWSIGLMFYEMLYGKTPWMCRDVQTLLDGIKNTPLRFPYDRPISNLTRDFIRRCLQTEEEKRMSWEDIFKHPLLAQDFFQRQRTTDNIAPLDEKAKKVLRKIQEIVQKYQIDIKDIFKHFDKDKGGTLDQNEFKNFLSKIDTSMTAADANNVFQHVDKSGDGSISFEEFVALFNEFDFAELGDLATHIINELRQIIKFHKLNLKDIFKNFDQDGQGTLDLKEFSIMIRVIAPGLKDNEVQEVFTKFDINGDGDISYTEFEQVLINVGPIQFTKQNTKNIQHQKTNSNVDKKFENAQLILENLKQIVKKKKLDVKKIFKNFDKSGDEKLDIAELQQLLKIFDSNINKEEVEYVFNYFDKDGSGSITMQEFEQALK